MEKLTIASLFMMLFLESWMNGTQLDEWLIDLHVTTIAKNAKNNVSKTQVNSLFRILKEFSLLKKGLRFWFTGHFSVSFAFFNFAI